MEWQDAEQPWAYAEYELFLQFEREKQRHTIATSKNPKVFINMWRNRKPISYECFAGYFAQISESHRLSNTIDWMKGYEAWFQETKRRNEEKSQKYEEFGFPDHIVQEVYDVIDRRKQANTKKGDSLN